jgi:predicted metal-binding protein
LTRLNAHRSSQAEAYLFTKVPASAASSLLQFGDLYRTSKTGDIPWKHFPEALQSTSVAKIPAV